MSATRAFFELELSCPDAVFAPRFETEAMVAELVAFVNARLPGRALRIADLGSGSGAIAAALAGFLPQARIDAYDKSAAACAAAAANFAALRLANVRLINASWDEARGSYDLIVSNPPYVTSACTARLLASGQLADPKLALDGGSDGLAAYREVIAIARRRLAAQGYLVFEHGLGQHYELVDQLASGGFDVVDWGRDLQGLKRFVIARAN